MRTNLKKLAFLSLVSILFMSSGKMLGHNGNVVTDAPFYGKDITTKESISIKEVTTNFKNYKGKEVVFDAKVGKVCVKKGCWMTLENGNTRVKFKDYKFFVPISLVGKKVRVSGIVSKKILSKEEAKHYLKDSGVKNPKITGTIAEYSVMATGVKPL